MDEISKEYLLLFNAVTDAERALAQLRQTLLDVQVQAEELFLSRGEDPRVLTPQRKDVDLPPEMEYNDW